MMLKMIFVKGPLKVDVSRKKCRVFIALSDFSIISEHFTPKEKSFKKFVGVEYLNLWKNFRYWHSKFWEHQRL